MNYLMKYLLLFCFSFLFWLNLIFAQETEQDQKKHPNVDTKRPLAQVVYDDCLAVYFSEFKEGGMDSSEAILAAHYVCIVVSGTCRDDPRGEECRKRIGDYDHNRKSSGPSELYKAAEAGKTHLVTQLLELGFDPNIPLGDYGWTPLMIASANGHQETVFILLSYGADVNAINKKGRTALMFASRYGYDLIVKDLLEKGANPNLISRDEPKWPALIAASFNGHSKTVSILLEHGADAGIKDEMGMTAYSWAEKESREDVLLIFKQKGITY